VKVETLKGVEEVGSELALEPDPPPPKVKVPVMWTELRLRVPVAPATPFSFAMEETRESSIVVSPGAELSRSRLKALLAFGVELPEGGPPPKWKPPELWGVAALVTVMSVPTPYKEWSTSAWAALTPAAAAVTVTTRPTPRAKPIATTLAERIRRRSSRPR
jgi:hypothetical protein